MHQTYDEAMRAVFVHEGGYCWDKNDPGGPTKYGITIFDYRKYLKADATADDVKTLTIPQAEAIYWPHYAVPMRYDDLPAGVDYSTDDYGINSGIGRSGRVLRRVCDMPSNDWHVTDDVLAALAKRDPLAVIDAIAEERLRFLKSLSTWSSFGGGWGRRVAEVHSLSRHMHSEPVAVPAPAPQERPDAEVIPLPTRRPVPTGAAPGKGLVPVPASREIVKKGGGAVSFGIGGVVHWIGDHPVLTAAAVAGAFAGVGYLIHAIDKAHVARQIAPVPNTPVVPVEAAA
jgi:lysozyme family protein